PRSIGSNLRGLIEEFQRQRPQLQVGLAWWAPEEDGSGPLRVFDGQHKAAAQILLGVKTMPLRVFVRPDTKVLLQANANAGDQLRQVAFDAAVKRHLGSTLYAERVRDYQSLKGLAEEDFSFSESDLVTFFRGEHREVLRYILDAVRDGISHSPDNRLMEFVEWAGKEANRPVAYSAIEKTFYSEFLYPKPLSIPIDFRLEEGENPRQLEKLQMVRLMSLVADSFFVDQWDPDLGGRKLEFKLQQGEAVPEPHVRAWRLGREEVLGVCVEWIRVVIENFYVWTGARIDRDRLLQQRFPEELWRRIGAFLTSLRDLPCWVDKGLSRTLFGAKQNRDAWRKIFDSGKSPQEVRVLTEPLDLMKMIGSR
ncbi:MAG: HNH endonuclease, partial [Deltaproteobacteria bacterium]|nr:HNH endonuclease [Deltaproteobacteria bacterium]